MEKEAESTQVSLERVFNPRSPLGKDLLSKFKPQVVFVAVVIAYTAYCCAKDDIFEIDCDVTTGLFFKKLGIKNFPGKLIKKIDSEDLRRAFWVIMAALNQHGIPKDYSLEPFGDLYQQLFDNNFRTGTGEFFTPAYLTKLVLQQIELDSICSVCDPSCGPGMFILEILDNRLKNNPSLDLKRITKSIQGLEINPLLALAARANYIRAIKDRLTADLDIEIPIFNIDSLIAKNPKQYDIIVGNPPWIGWEKLPKTARKAYQKLWEQYDLGEQVASVGIGKVRKEFSALFTSVVLDKYLKENGKLGFLITRSIIKNASTSGFRRLTLPNGIKCAISSVVQLTDEQPFPEVNSKFIILVIQKGQQSEFPAPYIHGEDRYQLVPQADDDWTQPWLVLTEPDQLNIYRKLASKTNYKAHLGCNNGGLAGCYWVDIIDETDTLYHVKNYHRSGKIEVPQVTAWIERDLVYTLIKSSTKPKKLLLRDLFIIIPHNPKQIQRPLTRAELSSKYPLAMNYFSQFEQLLKKRSGYKTILSNADEYWAIYNLGEYSNSPWKVCWSVFGDKLNARVLPERYQPMHTVAYISVENKLEAYFLMGLLNSSLFSFAMAASSFPSTKSFGTPSVIGRLGLPRFNNKLDLHKNISRLAVDYQGTVGFNAEKPNSEELDWIKRRIDTLVAELYGFENEVIDICKNALKKLQKL